MSKKLKTINLNEVIRGTLIKRFVKCSDKKCACHKGKEIHGPNWYVVYSENKKTHHVYIAKKHVNIVKKYIANYNHLWEQISKNSKINLQKIKGGNDNEK